jgi:hypothetical protein
MKLRRGWLVPLVCGGGVAALALASCGGGGGGGGGSGSRIEGNLSDAQAWLGPVSPKESRYAWVSLGLVGTAYAQAGGVQVCLSGSTICTTTDETGAFVLPVDGDLVAPVCLTFTGSNFSANLCLPFDIPNGTVVRISNIVCDPGSDACEAEDVDVDEPDDNPSNEVSDEDEPSVSEPGSPSQPGDDEDVSEDDGSGSGGKKDDGGGEDDVSED